MDDGEEHNSVKGKDLWRASRDSVTLQKWDPSTIFSTESLPIVKGVDWEDQGCPMSLFQALPIQECDGDEMDDFESCLLDGLGYCGGRVWAMAWRPDDEISHENGLRWMREYLAISVHSKDSDENVIRELKCGPGAIQIWSVSQVGDDIGGSKMEMEMAILHEGQTVWDLQWCPNPRIYTAEKSIQYDDYGLLGILVAALGSGEVQFLCIPTPDEVEVDRCEDFDSPLGVTINPVLTLTQDDLYGSCVSCVDWLPTSPHDLILLGCWNGFISIWQLPMGERCRPEILLQHRCEVLAIRRAMWMRPQPHEEEDIYRCTFCTGGHSGFIHIWDTRSIYEPRFSRQLSRAWILDVEMANYPRSLYTALEECSLRQICLKPGTFLGESSVVRALGDNIQEAVWTVSCQVPLGLGAYGGEDGNVGLFELSNEDDYRRRKPHLCAGAIKYDKGRLFVLTAAEVASSGDLCHGGFYRWKIEKEKGAMECMRSPQPQVIHCVRFSPNGELRTWVAAGTASGIVRFMMIER